MSKTNAPMTQEEIDRLIASIRNAMTVDELSAAEVARQSGFSEGYVSQLLNQSRQKVNPGPLLVIAHKLGLIRFVEEDAR